MDKLCLEIRNKLQLLADGKYCWSGDELEDLDSVLATLAKKNSPYDYCKSCHSWGMQKTLKKNEHTNLISLKKIVGRQTNSIDVNRKSHFQKYMSEQGYYDKDKETLIIPRWSYHKCEKITQEPSYDEENIFVDIRQVKTDSFVWKEPKFLLDTEIVKHCANCSGLHASMNSVVQQLDFALEMMHHYENLACAALQENIQQQKKLTKFIEPRDLEPLEFTALVFREATSNYEAERQSWEEKLSFKKRITRFETFQHEMFQKLIRGTTLDVWSTYTYLLKMPDEEKTIDSHIDLQSLLKRNWVENLDKCWIENENLQKNEDLEEEEEELVEKSISCKELKKQWLSTTDIDNEFNQSRTVVSIA